MFCNNYNRTAKQSLIEDKMKLPKKMTGESPRPSSVIGILREALTIPSRSWKLTGLILFLVLLPYDLLTLANNLLLNSVVRDLKSKTALLTKEDPSSPQVKEIADEMQKGTRLLLGLEVLYIIVYCVVALFALIVIVYSSAMIYTRNKLAFKELFSAIRGIWKYPVVTWFYVCLISVAYVLFVTVLIGVCMVISNGMVLHGLIFLVTLVAVVFYTYLSAIWMLGLVISILEDDCYGLMALGRAGELIKGRRLQGFALMLILSLLGISIPLAFGFTLHDVEHNIVAQLAVSIIIVTFVCLVKFFTAVVYTVFYFDCKAYGEGAQFIEAAFDPLNTVEVQ